MTDQMPITGPHGDDALLDLAAAYALDAVDDAERGAIDAVVADADPTVRDEFRRRVREHREALADYAKSTEQQPPADLLAGIMARIDADPDAARRPESDSDAAGPASSDPDAPGPASSGPASSSPASAGPVPPEPVSLDEARLRRRRRWTRGLGSAAAAAILVFGGVVIGDRIAGGPEAPPPAAQVFAASDVRTSAVDVAGGTATVVYSREANAAVLLMDGVAAPDPDTVYQLWLLGPDHSPTSVGVMESAEVTPSTQAVVEDIDTSTQFGISLEPPGGSPQPTNVLATVGLT